MRARLLRTQWRLLANLMSTRPSSFSIQCHMCGCFSFVRTIRYNQWKLHHLQVPRLHSQKRRMCANSFASCRLQIAIGLRLRFLCWRRHQLPNIQPDNWGLWCLHPWLLHRLHWKMLSKCQLLCRTMERQRIMPHCSRQLPKHQSTRLLCCLLHRLSADLRTMRVFPAMRASVIFERSCLHSSERKLCNLEPYKWKLYHLQKSGNFPDWWSLLSSWANLPRRIMCRYHSHPISNTTRTRSFGLCGPTSFAKFLPPVRIRLCAGLLHSFCLLSSMIFTNY